MLFALFYIFESDVILSDTEKNLLMAKKKEKDTQILAPISRSMATRRNPASNYQKNLLVPQRILQFEITPEMPTSTDYP